MIFECPVKDLLDVRLHGEGTGMNDFAGAENSLFSFVDLQEYMSQADHVFRLLQVLRAADQADPRLKADAHLHVTPDQIADLRQQAFPGVLRARFVRVRNQIDRTRALEIDFDPVTVCPAHGADSVGNLGEILVIIMVAHKIPDFQTVQQPDDNNPDMLSGEGNISNVRPVGGPAQHPHRAVHALLRAHDGEHDEHFAQGGAEHLDQQLRMEKLNHDRSMGQQIAGKQRRPFVRGEITAAVDTVDEPRQTIDHRNRINCHHQRTAGVAGLRRDGKDAVGKRILRQQKQQHHIRQPESKPYPFFPDQ